MKLLILFIAVAAAQDVSTEKSPSIDRYGAPPLDSVDTYGAPAAASLDSFASPSSSGFFPGYESSSGPAFDSYRTPVAPAGPAFDSYGAPSGPTFDSYGAPSGSAFDTYAAPSGPTFDSYGAPSGSAFDTYATPSGPVLDSYGNPVVPYSVGPSAGTWQPTVPATQQPYYDYRNTGLTQQNQLNPLSFITWGLGAVMIFLLISSASSVATNIYNNFAKDDAKDARSIQEVANIAGYVFDAIEKFNQLNNE